MDTAELLTAFEECPRKAFWMQSWQRSRMDASQMLQAAIRAGVTTERKDFGEAAGEECYGLGSDPGLQSEHYDVHGEVIHLACIADLLVTAIRKPTDRPWGIPEPIRMGEGSLWASSAYLDHSGSHLRRVVLVSNWSDDRHYSECRSWFSLGNVCVYHLPMQLVVIVLGQSREGKRHSAWAKGLLHPVNKKLRFRKKNAVGEPFKSSWEQIWREDHDEITTHDWLQTMLDDGVLTDLCFNVNISVPEKSACQSILDMAARKLEKLEKMKSLPDPQLTGCDWPKPCVFRVPCHAGRSPQKGPYRILESEKAG